jgi:hypothetical protein
VVSATSTSQQVLTGVAAGLKAQAQFRSARPHVRGPVSAVQVEGIERALFGPVTQDAIDHWLDHLISTRLSCGVSEVLFRSGRISAVYGLQLDDGSRVAVKVHRGEPDLNSLAAAAASQRWLADHGYPASHPIDGPAVLDGHVAVIESLLERGSPADAHDPAVRAGMAASFADQLHLLAQMDLPVALTERPAWTNHSAGPWPTPHDPIFDFSTTPSGFEWLDIFAQRASDALTATHFAPAVGHSDWVCGNVLLSDATVTGAFDWDSLVIDSEPVLAGRAAGGFTSGSTSGAVTPSPQEILAFLGDYERCRPTPFAPEQRTAALAAARWNLAYNARCVLSYFGPDSPDAAGLALDALAHHRDEYGALR